MNELCTACLCGERFLFYIDGTELYELYAQILKEILITDGEHAVCIRVCWECRAKLHHFQKFKYQTQQCYQQLLMYHVADGISPMKPSLERAPNIRIHTVHNYSFPEEDVKTVIKEELDENADLDIKDEFDTHYEPETFVNYLEVEVEVNKTEKKEKKEKSLKKKSKQKVKLKKNKAYSHEDTSPCLTESVLCTQCGDCFTSDLLLDKHIQVAHQSLKKKSKQKVKLKKNKAYSHEDISPCLTESVLCTQCGECFTSDLLLDKHIQVAHQEPAKQNGVRSRSKEQLPDKPQCVECGKMFSSKKTYRYHLNVLHKGQNRYPCPRCGKVYQWKSNLGRHMRSHKARDNGELYCRLCDKKFASVATYRQHLRVSRRHVSETDFTFMCNECGKKFVNKTRLRDHIDWEHLNNIKFRCQLCNKPFKCHTSLYVHMQNVHRNKEKKDNLCHVCGKSYQNAAKLKYHIIAMHTRETPYQCVHCGAAFGWYSSLYRHVREVHYKMKVQPKKAKKAKKLSSDIPPPPLASLPPGP